MQKSKHDRVSQPVGALHGLDQAIPDILWIRIASRLRQLGVEPFVPVRHMKFVLGPDYKVRLKKYYEMQVSQRKKHAQTRIT